MIEESGYHPVSKLLHWSIAGLIVVQFVLANLAESAGDADRALRELALLANHKSVGITVLALAIVRLGWRFFEPPPQLPDSMETWQKLASHVSHWSLYGLIVLVPLSGWLMSSATAYSVSWFNLFQLPDFVGPNEQTAVLWKTTHDWLAKILIAVAAVHILAALKHHFIDKDGVLARIHSRTSIAVFVVVIVAGVAALGSAGRGGDSGTGTGGLDSEPELLVAASSLPRWQIDAENSHIRFTGDQAGAEFDGEWQQWSADIRFDAERLSDSSFDVTILTAHVETLDDDRDTTLMDAEWFDTSNHPEAYFRATDFSTSADGSFSADGQLIIKGFAAPATLHFTVSADGERRLLLGSANLLRLDLGVGTGEWEDTTWVSNEVTVDVRVAATVESP